MLQGGEQPDNESVIEAEASEIARQSALVEQGLLDARNKVLNSSSDGTMTGSTTASNSTDVAVDRQVVSSSAADKADAGPATAAACVTAAVASVEDGIKQAAVSDAGTVPNTGSNGGNGSSTAGASSSSSSGYTVVSDPDTFSGAAAWESSQLTSAPTSGDSDSTQQGSSSRAALEDRVATAQAVFGNTAIMDSKAALQEFKQQMQDRQQQVNAGERTQQERL